MLPKITIVTPVLNQVKYIESTILSVLDQKYPNLEFIIIDGGSTDGTVDAIRKYSDQLTYWVSEADSGMYEALNKGFRRSSGELMGWINGGDVLLPNCLEHLSRIFADLPDLQWLQGMNSFLDMNGRLVRSHAARDFSLIKFLMGDYQWIQQESTFWRRSLWEDAGGRLCDSLRLAGDFELWFRFAQHATLCNVELPLGAWRITPGQLSEDKEEYQTEVQEVLDGFVMTSDVVTRLKKANYYRKMIKLCEVLRLPVPCSFKRRLKRFQSQGNTGVYYDNGTRSFAVRRQNLSH